LPSQSSNLVLSGRGLLPFRVLGLEQKFHPRESCQAVQKRQSRERGWKEGRRVCIFRIHESNSPGNRFSLQDLRQESLDPGSKITGEGRDGNMGCVRFLAGSTNARLAVE
jgi:hypothetical protein